MGTVPVFVVTRPSDKILLTYNRLQREMVMVLESSGHRYNVPAFQSRPEEWGRVSC